MSRALPAGTAPGPAPGLNPALRATAPAAALNATLNGSALVGLLAQLALSDRPSAPPSLVEGLGRWLGWREAIAVSAVLQAAPERAGHSPGPTAPPLAAPPAVPAGRAVPAADAAAQRLQAEVQRAREALARRIEEALREAPEDDLDFLPHRRSYFRAQQAMEQTLTPLREQARALLTRCGPTLAQLAALDAALAGALTPREQTLLAQLPVLLEKHHARLRNAATASSAISSPPHTPDPPAVRPRGRPAPPAWLTTFRHDMRRMLLAELELRLQPTLGLLDAVCGTAPVSA
jgi:hypothetical protein